MASLIIKTVKYEGDYYHYESPVLNTGLNIIEGDNGTGKSTFMNLIYYGLGGNVNEFKDNNKGTHLEIKRDTNNYVELNIEIDKKNYVLKRFFKQNDIIISDSDNNIEILPIFRTRETEETFSDWVLKKLNIEVVEVYQGINNWKINFSDLLRLIYHDQNPDPAAIYKAPDIDNFITDSVTLRKVIFQLLLGKTYSDYYSKLTDLKKAEKDKGIAKAVIDQYAQMAENMLSGEDLNLVFLKKRQLELIQQLKELYAIRDNLKENRPRAYDVDSKIEELKSEFLNNEIQLSDLSANRSDVLDEKIKLIRLKENIILEVTQLKKIVFTHNEMNLFAPDTCPYCLKKVERQKGHCVCGSEIDEKEYEKFFYNTSEYLDILKSKQKSVITLDTAIEACEQEISEVIEKIEKLNKLNESIKEKIKRAIGDIDSDIDIHALNDVDDKIMSAREKKFEIEQKIEFEEKRDEMQKKYDTFTATCDELKRELRQLEAAANEDISEKISEFDKKYNEVMRNTLQGCRSAKIGMDDYMPIINNGEYREKSAMVSTRLMYFYTLLYMSLKYKDIKYPKFLLVDNPQTSGIDLENLKNSFSQLKNIIPDPSQDEFQIILATGVDIYPEEFKIFVFETLSTEDRLLKLKKKFQGAQ